MVERVPSPVAHVSQVPPDIGGESAHAAGIVSAIMAKPRPTPIFFPGQMTDSHGSRVFHVSDRSDIACFRPRPPPSPDAGVTDDVVWAVSERLLHNYLLPRDCPRVTFYAQPASAFADVERFFAGSTAHHVVAIETAWLARLLSGKLWLYELPGETFSSVDDGAGYFVSRATVTPIGVTAIRDILAALIARDVELRVLPSLWKLRDAIFASTLAFSFIRMRNAQPRAEPVPVIAR